MASATVTVLPRRMTSSSANGMLISRNDDGTVTLKLRQPLTLCAEDLEEIVSELAALRAGMKPAFSLDPPPLSAIEPCCSPRHWVASDPVTGSVVLFFRHHLFGWIAIVQPKTTALAMLMGVAAEMRLLEDAQRSPDHELH